MPDTPKCLVVVGVGLIGGSIALAARSCGRNWRVVGVARSEASRQRVLKSSVVAEATTDLAAAAQRADVLIACTPVSEVARTLLTAARHCSAETLLTDAGSTKRQIVADVEGGLAGKSAAPAFVGSHPLAGDHRSGPESARADLLADRLVIVTPSGRTPTGVADRACAFWESLGAESRQMAPAEHDAALARTSHLPHLVAAAVAAATPTDALPVTATGWRDTTRVAAGPPALWRDILLANRGDVVAAIESVEGALSEFRQALVDRDADRIEQLLEQGRRRREAVGD
ncbi:MAG: prephenate dehydrogenase/arogenate dehydrogenase family protein [Planctomycetota bacterium]